MSSFFYTLVGARFIGIQSPDALVSPLDIVPTRTDASSYLPGASALTKTLLLFSRDFLVGGCGKMQTFWDLGNAGGPLGWLCRVVGEEHLVLQARGNDVCLFREQNSWG